MDMILSGRPCLTGRARQLASRLVAMRSRSEIAAREPGRPCASRRRRSTSAFETPLDRRGSSSSGGRFYLARRLRGREGGPDRVRREAQAGLQGPLAGRLRRSHVRVLPLPRAAPSAHARCRRAGRAGRSAGDVARALLRPRLRRGGQPARQPLSRPADHRPLLRVHRPVRAGVVGVDRLHLLREPLRHRRPAVPSARRSSRCSGRRARNDRARSVRRQDIGVPARLRRRARRSARALRAGEAACARGPGARHDLPRLLRDSGGLLARVTRSAEAVELRPLGLCALVRARRADPRLAPDSAGARSIPATSRSGSGS